jgi:KUP system potassium uptake protein
MCNKHTPSVAERQSKGERPYLSLAALGTVFGDIRSSPLYTFQTILHMSRAPGANSILGALSLLLWTLFVITTVKYVSFAMRVENDGEGGVLAPMVLLGVKKQQSATIVAAGLFGAALI